MSMHIILDPFHVINNDGMQFIIMYRNLDNDNVCARFAHLHHKLQFMLSNFTKFNHHTTILESITKHLVAKDINILHFLMDEMSCKHYFIHPLGLLMDE
jgi:hypothetical protein